MNPGAPKVILASSATWSAAGLFNPNEWSDDSQEIIQLCSLKLAVLIHCRDQIAEACRNSQGLCEERILQLQSQWQAAKFDPSQALFYVEVTDLHVWIEAFFSCVKSLLDLLVQLLSSEGVVGASVNGFHRQGPVYGGKVLKILSNNATAARGSAVSRAAKLIQKEKTAWIDSVIGARDVLIHPQKGLAQFMFRLELSQDPEGIRCDRIVPPTIDGNPADEYANDTIDHVQSFARKFLDVIR